MTYFLTEEDWFNVLDNIAPFISTSSERKQTIRTFLPDMLDAGYSGAKALSIFREAGLGISDATFYDIRRDILEDTNLSSYLRTLGLNEIVSENLMRISSREMDTKYRYVASYAINSEDGTLTQFGEFAFDTDYIGTKEDILNMILDGVGSVYDIGEYETLTVNLRRAYINIRD